MSDWTPSVENPGYMDKSIQKGTATIVISRPILSEEERTAREGKTRTTLEGVMRDYLHRKELYHGKRKASACRAPVR